MLWYSGNQFDTRGFSQQLRTSERRVSSLLSIVSVAVADVLLLLLLFGVEKKKGEKGY